MERENVKRHNRAEDKLIENEKKAKAEQDLINNRMTRLEEALSRSSFSKVKQ